MKDEKPNRNLKSKGGRKLSTDPATYRYTVNFTEKEYIRFITLLEKSGFRYKAGFIKARIFNQEFKMIIVDSSMNDFIAKLTNLHAQFRAVGVNINQITKIFQMHFSERKAQRILQGLLKEVLLLITIHRKVLEVLDELRDKKRSDKTKIILK